MVSEEDKVRVRPQTPDPSQSTQDEKGASSVSPIAVIHVRATGAAHDDPRRPTSAFGSK